MPIYQTELDATASQPARRFRLNAPNEIWAHELAARRAGYANGYDGYLSAREADSTTPVMRVSLIPTLTDQVA